ncbi:MAG: heavy metal translocating P-type ATPase [Candidatus Lokiarchaeota archaeon]|nr:heavy metal translocating P-type ATPase [Candidatus Lokiarchaeota archaeon]
MSDQEPARRANLKIAGMTCASCVATIEKSVKNLDGVIDVKVNLSTEDASLEYDPARVDLGKVEKVVTDLGYSVVNERVDVKIGGMHCAACVATLEKAIGGVSGVSGVVVNLAAENAVVQYNRQTATIDDIKGAIEGAGYQYLGKREELTLDAEAEAVRMNLADKKRRALIGIGVGIVLFAMMLLWIPGTMDMDGMQLRMYVMLAIATPAFLYTSFPIFKAMLSSLKNRSLNMDVMYGMGIGVAYGASVAGTFLGGIVHALMQFMFFDAAVMLSGFLMLGRYLETRAKSRTSDAIKKLVGLQPKVATVIREGKEETIAAEDIEVGDLILIKPGERLPADGVVKNGSSYVDESMITGEPIPVLKQVDSKVVGGTINKNSVLQFAAQRVGKDTVLSQIIKLVQEAQSTKPPIQKLADKAVAWFIPVVLAIAIATFAIWLAVLGEWLDPLTRLITILVVACPCALGLATPTAVTVGIGRGAELGILIKNGEVLEKVNKMTTVIFDKTGTLTKGRPEVTDVVAVGMLEDDLLAMVAAVEAKSQHPLADAIVREYRSGKGRVKDAVDFDTAEGKGVKARVDGKLVIVGSRSYLKESGVDATPVATQATSLEEQAKTVVHVAIDGRVAGVIGIADTIREHAKAAVEELHRMGISTMMITGDNEQTARAIASQIGITDVIAEVLPQEKASEVQKLQESGKVVAFTGDGINDAPALARADVGIAMGGGTDVAIESGELVVMRDDPADAVSAIQLSKKVLGRIKLNLFWAFAYNVVLIPIAIFGVVAPEWAGLAMAMSSVTVVSLSLLLKRFVPAMSKRIGPTEMPAIPPADAPMTHAEAFEMASTTPQQGGPVLRCQECGEVQAVPWHCNQPMHVELVGGKEKLVCWMGPACGEQDIPSHHRKPMLLVEAGEK